MTRMIRTESTRNRFAMVAALALIALVLFAACEEDQSAVSPGAVREFATAAADAADTADDTGSGFTGIGNGSVGGEPLPPTEHVYFTHGADIWRIDREGDPEPVLEGLAVASFSSDATGDTLAILELAEATEPDGEQTSLSIRTNDGALAMTAAMSEGVDDLQQIGVIESVAVNPDGDVIAVTHTNGAMTLLSREGEITRIMEPSIEHRPGRVLWSPDGQFIAYLDPWMPAEPSSLYVVLPARDIRQALIHPTSDGHGVVRARWVPGTSYLVVSRASGSTIPHGGDLFLIDVETGYQELLMSSGEIAPVAGIVDIAPSPDGDWLAVTGFVPGANHPGFAGLWLINLRSGLRLEPSIPSGETVTNLWWLGEDLLFRTISEPRTSLPGTYTGREAFKLLQFDPNDERLVQRYPEAEQDEGDDDE
jgi:hypothetical protein